MKQLRNILVIADPTRGEQSAIAKAARLAKHSGARVLLYACETPYSRETRLLNTHRDEPGRAFLPLDLRALAASWSEPLRAQGIEVETECDASAHLHTAAIKRVCASGIDLVVKDAHFHSLAQRAFLTNTDWHLIRGCSAPLLLTKAAPWRARPVILAAIDPTHEHDKPALLDHHLLEWGSTLRKLLSGELHALHAYMPFAIGAPTVEPEAVAALISALISKEEPQRKARVLALTAEYDLAEQNIHLDVGNPTEVIPRVAKSLGADIVTMGAVSRSSAALFLVGHTAERVIERLESDMLIVKPPDFSACLPL